MPWYAVGFRFLTFQQALSSYPSADCIREFFVLVLQGILYVISYWTILENETVFMARIMFMSINTLLGSPPVSQTVKSYVSS
jgi:hypothetical protein